jgi:Zn-dependent protease
MKFEFKPSAVVLFALFAALYALRLGWREGVWAAVVLLGSILVHELGHVFALRRHGIEIKAIGITHLGGFTRRASSDNWFAEVQSALAGPAASLLLYFIFRSHSGEFFTTMATANAVIGLSNLIPIGPTDGRRLLRILLPA